MDSRTQFEQPGGQVDEGDDRQADEDPDRAGAADEHEQPVDQDRDDHDVDDREPAAAQVGIEEVADRFDHDQTGACVGAAKRLNGTKGPRRIPPGLIGSALSEGVSAWCTAEPCEPA